MESSDISDRLTHEAGARKMNMVADGVADGTYRSMELRMEEFRAIGYKEELTEAVYLNTDLGKAWDGVGRRLRKSGRDVPWYVFAENHIGVSKVVPRSFGLGPAGTRERLFKNAKLYDTSNVEFVEDAAGKVHQKGKPFLVAKIVNGKPTVVNRKGWNVLKEKGRKYRYRNNVTGKMTEQDIPWVQGYDAPGTEDLYPAGVQAPAKPPKVAPPAVGERPIRPEEFEPVPPKE